MEGKAELGGYRHGKVYNFPSEEICSCCCPPFQNPSAMFASHLHAAGVEEMSGSRSSMLDYNPRGGPPCHAWHLTSAANAVTRHAF